MAPLEHRSINVSGRSLGEIVRMVEDGSVLVDTPYQRGDVWTEDQQRKLIKSLIMGIPIPAIVLNARHLVREWRVEDPNAEVGWACIDGKQRLIALLRWTRGELAIPAEWLEAEFLERFGFDPNVNGGRMTTTFDGLSAAGKRYMSRWSVPLAEATLRTLNDEIDVYLLINRAGTVHTQDELDKAEGAWTLTPPTGR